MGSLFLFGVFVNLQFFLIYHFAGNFFKSVICRVLT
jgi:hypothetical protein